MCVVSMVGDYYADRWKYIPNSPTIYPTLPASPIEFQVGVSQKEFQDLKREVEEMRELLKAAKRIDEITGQADCEQADKVALLRRVAEMVGVDLADVLDA